jgi:thiamine pyrophosphokinase
MEVFDRNNIKYDALVCLNATLPSKLIFGKFTYDKLLAADGAADKVFAIGIYPDAIIGDFDSLNRNAVPNDYDIQSFIVDHSQETNDFEKILTYCIDNNMHNLLIFGMHGGELEHTLNNISVFKKYSSNLQMTIYDAGRIGILINDSIQLETNTNEIISLIPLPEARISTKNLKWELSNEKLELGIREGARNESIAEFIEIHVHKGELLLYFDAKN